MEVVRIQRLLIGFYPRHGADEVARLQQTGDKYGVDLILT
jgi:hypothetical protein